MKGARPGAPSASGAPSSNIRSPVNDPSPMSVSARAALSQRGPSNPSMPIKSARADIGASGGTNRVPFVGARTPSPVSTNGRAGAARALPSPRNTGVRSMSPTGQTSSTNSSLFAHPGGGQPDAPMQRIPGHNILKKPKELPSPRTQALQAHLLAPQQQHAAAPPPPVVQNSKGDGGYDTMGVMRLSFGEETNVLTRTATMGPASAEPPPSQAGRQASIGATVPKRDARTSSNGSGSDGRTASKGSVADPSGAAELTLQRVTSSGGTKPTVLDPEVSREEEDERSSDAHRAKLQRMPPGSDEGGEYAAVKCYGSNFVALSTMFLSGKKMEVLPERVLGLDYLLELYLADNQLADLPEGMSNLKKLEKLYMGGNKFTQIPPVVFTLFSLKELSMCYNEIKAVPNDLQNLKELRSLQLHGNAIAEWPTCSLKDLADLETLIIHSNQLIEIGHNFGELVSLAELDCRRNMITVIHPNFEKLVNLRQLDLEENQIMELPNLSNFCRLIKLDAHSNDLTHNIRGIEGCAELQELNLSNNNLTKAPANIGECSQLRFLALDNNQLKEVPNEFGGLLGLEELTLANNKIEEMPLSLIALPRLNPFDMSGNPFWEAIESNIKDGGFESVMNYFGRVERARRDMYARQLSESGETGRSLATTRMDGASRQTSVVTGAMNGDSRQSTNTSGDQSTHRDASLVNSESPRGIA